MNDDDVLNVVRDSMSGVRMSTPAHEVISAARARRRHRRLAATAGGGVLAAAVAWTLTLGGQQVNAPPAVHVQMAAFSIDSNADGTVTVKLTKEESLDPATMKNALARAGVPAEVTINKWCDTTPPGGQDGLEDVVTMDKVGDRAPQMIITPSAMPAGTKLLIGIRTPDYQPDNPNPLGATMILASTDAPLTCSTDIPHRPEHGKHPARDKLSDTKKDAEKDATKDAAKKAKETAETN
ncbi:hypothetical protein [Streptosporangium sp. LJ11]|uniref:hypothetical protein n=1 Tax=Streptosporangium sp. LJ11 TaxID=3436927 RepID=UPI003F794F7D